MERNLILAGVGGQGILTIAQAISLAAVHRGWHVKQSEVHGMSQRGGAVQSHLRLADHPIHSDLIPHGRCDLILSMEPLEALRYVEYLREDGAIVTNTGPLVNIPNYPPIEEILDQVSACENHVLVDAERLARAAGASRAVNSAVLGAGLLFLGLSAESLQQALADIFAAKGTQVIEANCKALSLGLATATVYRDALARGLHPRTVRRWITSVPPEQLATSRPDACGVPEFPVDESLSAPESHAVGQILEPLREEGRTQLYEHEVYALVQLVGAIHPPRHHFVPYGQRITVDVLEYFPGDTVVLKVVSPEIIHKTDAGAVSFVPKDIDSVNRGISSLLERQRQRGALLAGVLVVEFVERDESSFGQELFVGVRRSREFGAILAAGVGGIDTEFLSERMKPGIAVAKSPVGETSPEDFMMQFQQTAAYEILAGRARGHQRVVTDGELLRCFRAFLALGRRLCLEHADGGPFLEEIEVNPFAFVHGRMIPLDGRGRCGEPYRGSVRRPLKKIDRLLEPRSMALVGVSAKRENFGRIILDNTLACGFPSDQIRLIQRDSNDLLGVRCVAELEELEEPVDLLVVATAADSLLPLMQQAIDRDLCTSIILIPGGLGETAAGRPIEDQLRRMILASRQQPTGGPVVLGPNCLGIRSRPGHYDTFFIPAAKLASRRDEPASRCALITQSGAFAATVISNLQSVNPALAVTMGNQLDLTASDLMWAVGGRDDIDAIGVYVEGFKDLDGLEFIRAVDEVCREGKTVVFYKAGKTPAGRSATAGHTASVAGDYEVCQAAVGHAGAIVVDTFKEFEQVLELATLFHDKVIHGRRLGVMSNAGFEAVGMADAIQGARYELELGVLGDVARQRIRQALTRVKLDTLVTPANPLDLNPMADEQVYEEAVRAMMEDPQVDAVVVSIVPFTPRLRTTDSELQEGLQESLAGRLPRLQREYDKPLVMVIDAGESYAGLAAATRRGGVPVFPSCDQAIRSLGRYICQRIALDRPLPRAAEASPAPVEVHS